MFALSTVSGVESHSAHVPQHSSKVQWKARPLVKDVYKAAVGGRNGKTLVQAIRLGPQGSCRAVVLEHAALAATWKGVMYYLIFYASTRRITATPQRSEGQGISSVSLAGGCQAGCTIPAWASSCTQHQRSPLAMLRKILPIAANNAAHVLESAPWVRGAAIGMGHMTWAGSSLPAASLQLGQGTISGQLLSGRGIRAAGPLDAAPAVSPNNAASGSGFNGSLAALEARRAFSSSRSAAARRLPTSRPRPRAQPALQAPQVVAEDAVVVQPAETPASELQVWQRGKGQWCCRNGVAYLV